MQPSPDSCQLKFFCQLESKASLQCIEDHEYNRSVYKTACQDQFDQYLACKKRWTNECSRMTGTRYTKEDNPGNPVDILGDRAVDFVKGLFGK